MTQQYSGGSGGSSSLAGDSDVSLAGLANLNALQYQTGDSKWHNVVPGIARLDEQLPGGAVTTITFAAIPQTYRHLKIIFQARSDLASTAIGVFMRFNGDTAGNYDYVRSIMVSGGATLSDSIAATQGYVVSLPGANSPTNSAGIGEILIPYYAGTTFKKQYQSVAFGAQLDTTTNLMMMQAAGEWRSTAAITSVTLFLTAGGGNYVLGSSFALDGVG